MQWSESHEENEKYETFLLFHFRVQSSIGLWEIKSFLTVRNIVLQFDFFNITFQTLLKQILFKYQLVLMEVNIAHL